ncbi:MAG TPA: oxygenase MpaB family protein [Pseudonocardia sp.]|nr:oxygenase MpaB family protein [Pseudonocardia sp.]
MNWESGVSALRERIGSALFERVAGPQGPENRARIHDSAGPRWFSPDRPIRRVHGDAAMFVGGLRALLLQSLHPLAMAGIAEHSDYRGDPWGRLARTSTFLAVTTYGTADDAQQAVERVRAIHRHVQGVTDAGVAYDATDPHLLKWVHLAEIDSFLAAHQRYGTQPLDQAGRDAYVADTATVATALGVRNPPHSERELRTALAEYRGELHATRPALDAAKFLLYRPPLPLVARAPYALLAAGAVVLLPVHARDELRIPRLPVLPAGTDTAITFACRGLVHGIRWAMQRPG